LKGSTEIETLQLNPSPQNTRRFRRDPANAGVMSSESAALCGGGDARVKKTAGLRGGVCEPFSSACAMGSIARVLPKGSLWDDSEKLSLLLSLASENEESWMGWK
jgi:hypothetical protein